ncbi:MAG TPA: beta-galactosidase family protein [Bacteroidota bacterium]|nr:beta-galactosidase family protein [Bacteroidota bacterium]
MERRIRFLFSLLFLVLLPFPKFLLSQTFTVGREEFLLDGKPFQVLAGEMHFQRIPREYWKDRLLKAKAMGLNTVSTYVFWNSLEPEPGQWDFSGNNDLRRFVLTAKEVFLFVNFRPGPYACAEWDFGGLPAWLLRVPDIRVRCMDPRYIAAVENYIKKLSGRIRDLQNSKGGPIIMLQIENEYGSFGNDRVYLRVLKQMWERAGITIPKYTADGATPYMLEAGTVPGAFIGLDPGANEKHFAEAERFNPEVPAFCSEYYPGWLTHWGEQWAKRDTVELLRDVKWLMDNQKSFSLYVLHGGTNFGWMAGANFSDTYEPHVTSYDYDAPLSEMGEPTYKYFAFKKLISRYLPNAESLPALPPPLPVIAIPDIQFTHTASLFDNLPPAAKSPQPKPMEASGQNYGFILYRTQLVGHHSGKLVITELHDYANVYIDGRYIASIDRARRENSIDIPKSTSRSHSVLEILVEGMGRINFGQHLIDRKGITNRVTLNGSTLMSWEMVSLPMDSRYLRRLKFAQHDSISRPAAFFRGTVHLNELGDTYLDVSKWKKGVAWINGHNLGRYWEIGPQQRLFVPAPWLKMGTNEIIIFDLHQTKAAVVSSAASLHD